MRVLVTGAHGFVGSHVVRALRAGGHEVIALSSPWGTTERLAFAPEVVIHRADVADLPALLPAFRGVEVVVHAAAKVAEWGPWPPFHRANVLGTQSVLHAAVHAGARRFVHISTVAVSRYRGFLDADPRSAPRDGAICAYARSKAVAETFVAEARGIETVIVRPGAWPFGPGDPTLPRLLRALAQPFFPLVDGGRRHLNTAFVDNLAQGIALAATLPAAAGRLYLIADDGMPTWRAVLSELARSADLTPRWVMLPGAAAAAAGAVTEALWARFAPRHAPPIGRYAAALMRRDLHFSTRHARSELGYAPTVTWRDGLARTIAALPRRA
jgi:2-alkyl-3-oxoalkanoate reductase